MRKQISVALAAGLLMAGVSAASAAGMSQSNSTMSRPASNTLSLTTTEQKAAWNALHGQAIEQKAPFGFNAIVGAVVPSTVKIEPVPSKAASDVPMLKPFDFAMVSGKLLIVNPSDKKIVEVVSG
jgi:hypothetical protein